MQSVERNILLEILNEHSVMSLATVAKDSPRSTPLFYAIADEGRKVLFMSEKSTQHCHDLENNPKAAIAIYSDSGGLVERRGVQLEGSVECPQGEERRRLEKIYLKCFPFSLSLAKTNGEVDLYSFITSSALVTDKRLGFGSKVFIDFSQTA